MLLLTGNIFAQDEKQKTIGIVNGRATYLPKPDYPQKAEDFCAAGKVEVKVLIGEKRKVIEAEAISGDEPLKYSAVEAAKKAKFAPTPEMPVKTSGIVVYNFIPKQKCINGGIVNTRAKYLPKPQVANLNQPKHLQTRKDEIVIVQIIVDLSGNVTNAEAVLGHQLLRSACEFSARQTKFAPTLITGGSPFKINALLAYRFKADGTIDTQIERDDKDVVGLPTNLVEPPPPFCNCRFSGNSSVIVQVEIDEKGNVIEATAFSGHPILRLSSEKAALESKFIPANVKTKKYIRYNFEEINKYSVKISSIEMTEIESKK